MGFFAFYRRKGNRVRSDGKRKRKPQSRRSRELLTALPVILLSAFLLGTYCSSFLTEAALFSARLLLPRTNLKRSVQDAEPAGPAKAARERPIEACARKPPPPAPSVLPESDVPEDILSLMREAQEQYGAAPHDGVIVEKQYGAASASSVFENITVRNTTSSHGIDIEASLKKPAPLKIADKTQPTVLIFHTHTTESYQLLDNGWYTNQYATHCKDPARGVVRVGQAICAELQKAGIGVIHDTEIHDTAYSGAYARSREAILKILAEHPSLQIVLDVHRDAIEQKDGTRIKPTAKIQGRKAAQIMIIAGCEDGKVRSFPSWEQNLTFDLQLHQTAETAFPGLMRPLLFSARKYNMDVVPCSALLEIGSDSNALAEAVYSGQLMGRALVSFIEANAAK